MYWCCTGTTDSSPRSPQNVTASPHSGPTYTRVWPTSSPGCGLKVGLRYKGVKTIVDRCPQTLLHSLRSLSVRHSSFHYLSFFLSVSLYLCILTLSLALDYIPIFVLFVSGNKKPYTDRQGNSDAMNRHVADQPYKIGERYNARKLNNLAYHRIMSEDLDRSKEDCLCNFQFILHRIKGTSVR